MQTIFDILTEEHTAMRFCVTEAEHLATHDITLREKLLVRLERSLVPHARGEELTLYREMEQHPDLRLDALEAVDEHALIDSALATLTKTLHGDLDEWHAAAQVLRETVHHHLDEEERKTFPAAQSALASEVIARITEEYLATKQTA